MAMHNPPHPGEMLREDILAPLGVTIIDAAEHLGISRKTLSKVLNGRGSITPEMALRLEKCFGTPPANMWLRMQAGYDLWQLEHGTELNVTPIAA